MTFTVRSSRGRGWLILENGVPVPIEKFNYRGDAQRYADMRNYGWDHARSWNEVYREGEGGQAGDHSLEHTNPAEYGGEG